MTDQNLTPNDPAPAPATGDPAAPTPSLLNPDPAASAQPGPNDWLPSKFHVNKDDGSFDTEASARKLAESYTALEKHKGPVLTVPESPEGYKIEAPLGEDGKPLPGLDIEEFVKDPLFQGIAAKAHKAGIPNEHMQFFIGEYLRTAPELLGANSKLTIDEASSQLSKVWTDEKTFEKNLATANRVRDQFTKDVPADQPGSFDRLQEKFSNDPDFVAFLARVGGELEFGEDKLPSGAPLGNEADIEALMKGEAYWNANHADHAKVKEQVAQHFAKRYGTALHR